MRLQPKQSFTIKPRADFTFAPKGYAAKHGNVGVYSVGPKNEFVLRRRTGKLSQKGVAGRLNMYYEQGGTRVGRIFVYSQSSRVMQGTDNLLAVKIGEEKGWLTETGRFIGEEEFRAQLHSIDSTSVGQYDDMDALVKKWDSLSAAQKAKVVDAFRDYNWDDFWAQFYPRFTFTVNKKEQIIKRRRSGSETWEADVQFQMYDEIVRRMAEALGEW